MAGLRWDADISTLALPGREHKVDSWQRPAPHIVRPSGHLVIRRGAPDSIARGSASVDHHGA